MIKTVESKGGREKGRNGKRKRKRKREVEKER